MDDKRLKQLEAEQRKLLELEKKTKKSNFSKSSYASYPSNSSKNDLWQFLIGLVLLGVGLFWVFQSVRVGTGFGIFPMFGGLGVPNGTVIIPLLIGIVMLFVMERKIFGWIVTALGVAIILTAVITSVHLYFATTSLFEFILMFGFIFVGGALVIKSLFKK